MQTWIWFLVFYGITVVLNVVLTKFGKIVNDKVGIGYYILWVILSPLVLSTLIASLIKDGQDIYIQRKFDKEIPFNYIEQAFRECGFSFKEGEVNKFIELAGNLDARVFTMDAQLMDVLVSIEKMGGIRNDGSGYYVVEDSIVWNGAENTKE